LRPRSRRRRRRPPQFGGAADRAGGSVAGPTDPASQAAAPTSDPNRRPRRPRHRRPGDGPPGQTAPRTGGDRRPQHARPPDAGGAAQDRNRDDQRERGPRREGRPGQRDRRDGRGRGRDDGPRRVERKLYSFDSVVDRGFEDVEEESETRRVHWTIVKRTVADQISRKAMSQSYVLQRDGADSEFPTLGAARDAVNKKIVHPEKLTLSKAEHAAAKKS
jgi:hypothetical protein